jgi:hypothetical protein
MRTVLVSFVVGLAAAASASGAGEARSGLHGTVTRAPIRPVCVPERPCSAPARGVTLTFSRNGDEVARARTGDDGSYRVRLPAGSYAVRTIRRGPRRLEPSHVRVSRGRYARVNFSLDTGIR